MATQRHQAARENYAKFAYRAPTSRRRRPGQVSVIIKDSITQSLEFHYRMIRFLQTPGPTKKIILGGLLLIVCVMMMITLVPGGMFGDYFGSSYRHRKALSPRSAPKTLPCNKSASAPA